MNEFSSAREPQVDAVVDKAKAAGREVQSTISDLAGNSADALKDHISHTMDAAKDIASSAQDRLSSKMTEQKGIGVDYANNFADAMRRAANQFDSEVPMAGDYIRKAAGQLQSAADAVKDGNLNDLMQSAQTFARSQPTAFFGLALLAGFGAVRFLKSASTMPGQSASEPDRHDSANTGWAQKGSLASYDQDRRPM